jgi:hypothetical protein
MQEIRTVRLEEHPDFNDRRLACYLPSERRAILVHRYFLGIDCGYDPGLDGAIESWEVCGVGGEWRQRKMHIDRVAQMSEIERHRSNLAGRNGRDIAWDEAAWDWVKYHAERWRRDWEATPAAGA